MLITIKDSKTAAVIDSTGAQLISLKDVSGHEYIWQRHPEYWGKCSPLLFPVVGNCRNDRTILEDRIYAIEKHGFCREHDFDVSQVSPAKAVFTMEDTPDTHRVYPYAFCLSLTYELKDGMLSMEYQVKIKTGAPCGMLLGLIRDLTAPWRKDLHLRITGWNLNKKKIRSVFPMIWSSCTLRLPNQAFR